MSTLPSCKILEQKSIYFIVYHHSNYLCVNYIRTRIFDKRRIIKTDNNNAQVWRCIYERDDSKRS